MYFVFIVTFGIIVVIGCTCTVYSQAGMCRVTVDDSGLCSVHVTSFPPLINSFCFFPALNNPLCLFISYSAHSAQR